MNRAMHIRSTKISENDTVYVEAVISRVLYKAKVDFINPLDSLSDSASSELHFIKKALEIDLISPGAIVYTHHGEDLTRSEQDCCSNLNFVALDEAVFEELVVETVEKNWLKLGKSNDEIYQKERTPLAITSIGAFQLSNKVVDDAIKIVPSINSAEDLIKYLGSRPIKWTVRSSENTTTKYFECGRLVCLVDTNVAKKYLPILVYAFESQSKFTSATLTLDTFELFLTYAQWTAIFDIVENYDGSIVGDYQSTSLNRVLSRINASVVEVNGKVIVTTDVPALNDVLVFENDGSLFDEDALLLSASKVTPIWRTPIRTSIGDIVLTKIAATKLGKALNVELSSLKFMEVVTRNIIQDVSIFDGTRELQIGDIGLLIEASENGYMGTECIPSSHLYHRVETRFGVFKLPKTGVVTDSFKRAFKVPHKKNLTPELIRELTDGDVFCKIDVDTDDVKPAPFKSAAPICFLEKQVELKLRRIRTDGLLNDLLEVTYSGSIEPKTVLLVGDKKIEVSKSVLVKAKDILGILDTSKFREVVDQELQPSLIGKGKFECALGKSGYCLVVDKYNKATSVDLSRNAFFYIINDDFRYVIKRNSQIERPLMKICIEKGLAKSYQQLREVISREKITNVNHNQVSKNKKEFTLTYSGLGLSIVVKQFNGGGVGLYPLPMLVSFKFI